MLVFQGTSEARTPSQGVLTKGPKQPEENFPPYSQTVDNASSQGTKAKGWQTSDRGTDIYGADYLTPGDARGSARYKFKIPATDTYSVFAWWPVVNGAASSVDIKIRTGKGVKVETVDQSRDGGYWVPIGEYEMRKGSRYSVKIPAGSDKGGKVIADAVAVVRGTEAFPKGAPKVGNSSEGTGTVAKASNGGVSFAAAAGRNIPRRALVRRAKARLGQPYDYNNGRCTARARAVDCSCLTRLVYYKWRKLPDHPRYQWYGAKQLSTRFKSKSLLRPGDLAFFDEDRNGYLGPHDSVAIYVGNGRVIMASGYFGKVSVIEMKYLDGFWGGKRLRY